MSETPLNQDQNSDEIDLKDLIIPIWKARKQILAASVIFSVLGGILAFLTPATYTASSTFLPQTAQSGGAGAGLGGLAALAGINLNTPLAGGDIPPSMYAKVLGSEPFRKRILDAKIWMDGDSITYRSYLENRPSSTLGTIQEYTIGLPGKILTILASKEEKIEVVRGVQEIKHLTKAEYGLLNQILSKVSITLKEGLITISVIEDNPIVAAQITNVIEKVLQSWINEYKTKNAKTQYDFIEKQFYIKQKEFFAIQEQLATYKDQNQNIFSSTFITRLDRLQSEFDLVNAVYSELAKQKEQAAIQLSKDTPTFSVLDPVKIPMEKTGPNKRNYVLISFFIGFILSSAFSLLRKPILVFVNNMKIS